MKNRGNKIWAFLTVSFILFSFASVPTFAETEGYYTFDVENGEATITSVSTSISGIITIPSELGGYKVTKIGELAFVYKDITGVRIPDTVTHIDNDAFASSHIRWVVIPDSVTYMGGGVFSGCDNLSSVEIGSGIKTISSHTFYSCSNIKSITIPSGVTDIGWCAFCNCRSLKSIIIPKSVTTIGKEAFISSDNISDVYYSGTEDDWSKISFGESNYPLQYATKHYNSIFYNKELSELTDYNGANVTLLNGGVLDTGEDLNFRNGYVDATNGYVKAGDKKITGSNIYFNNEGKIRLDSGDTAKVEKDNGDGTTDQGFIVGVFNPKNVITMILEVYGTLTYADRTITKEFDFTNSEISGLANFGFTVKNIPKPLYLTIKSVK